MIHWLIDASLRNRFLIIAGFLLVGGWGYWALRTTPLDAIPDLSDNQVIVFTDWMGRSPQEVEDQITYPLTVSLQGLPGVRVVRSSAAFGFSMINVIFEDAVDLYFRLLVSQVEVLALQVKTLVGLGPEAPLSLRGDLRPAPVRLDRREGLMRTLAARSDLLMARAEVAMTEAMIQKEEAKGRWDASVNVGYMRQDFGYDAGRDC